MKFNISTKILLILFFCLLWFPYFFNGWAYSIWDSNEAYYVEGPKEMLIYKDLFTPYFNYEYRFEKPILSYWIVIFFYKLFGISVSSERLAIAFFALLSIILTYLISRNIFASLYDIKIAQELALFSSATFAISFKFFTLSHRSIIDILLTFWVLSALFFYLKFLDKNCQSLMFISAAFICFALGVLAKGLLGIVVPAGIIFFHILLTKRFFIFKDLKFYLGILLFIIIASPWFIYMAYKHGLSYLQFFFLGNHIELYLKGAYSLPRPIWYYIPNIAGGFAPWSCFFLFILSFLYYSIKNKIKIIDKGLFILIWVLYIFLFFSLSKGKQEEYVLQIYPGLSILLIWAVQESLTNLNNLILKKLKYITVCFLSFLYLSICIIVYLFNKAIFPEQISLNLFVILFLLFSIFSIVGLKEFNLKKIIIICAAFNWVVYCILIVVYLPLFDKEYKYVRYFAEKYKELKNESSRIGYYKVGIPSLCYYANEKVYIFKNVKEIEEAKKEGELYLIIDENSFNNFSEDLAGGFNIIDERKQFPTTFRNFMKLFKGYGKERILLLAYKGKFKR